VKEVEPQEEDGNVNDKNIKICQILHQTQILK
jgi:hypothetical protein